MMIYKNLNIYYRLQSSYNRKNFFNITFGQVNLIISTSST